MAVSFRGSTSGVMAGATSVTPAMPAGTLSTDILVMVIDFTVGTANVWTAPAGWTAIVTNLKDSNIGCSVWWALGSVASAAFTANEAHSGGWVLSCYSGVDNVTPIDATGTAAITVNSTTATANAVTVLTVNSWELIGSGEWLVGAMSAPGFSIAANGNPSTDIDASLFYNTTPKSTGSTGTVTITSTAASANQHITSVPFALRPAGAATQSGYRFRNDDGTEAAATWLASEGAAVTQPLATNTRLRVQVDTAGDTPATAYQLEYKKSTDAGYSKALTTQPATQLPAFVAKGTFASGTAGITPGLPAGIQAGDLLLLFVETANQAMTTPAGYTQVTNSPQSTGSAGVAGGVRLTVFYKVATASETASALADSGDHQTAIIMAFRGVDNTTPFNTTAGKIDSTAGTTVSCPAVTTTAANCLIVHGIALDADLASTTNLSAVANAALSGVTLRHTQTVIAGAGGGLAVITGGEAAAGSTGATTATDATSEVRCYLTMALNPTPVNPVPILLTTSANIAAGGGTATTAQLTPPTGKTAAAFQAGRLSDDTNPMASIDLGADVYTELEWCLQSVSPAVNTDVYQFRVSGAGAPLDTYSVTPQLTVGTPVGGAPALSPAAITGHL